MNKSRKWNIDECMEELRYIQSIDSANPGSDYGYDLECFKRYIAMQQGQFIHSGFPMIAAELDN
jgi:hypothetical protein